MLTPQALAISLIVTRYHPTPLKLFRERFRKRFQHVYALILPSPDGKVNREKGALRIFGILPDFGLRILVKITKPDRMPAENGAPKRSVFMGCMPFSR